MGRLALLVLPLALLLAGCAASRPVSDALAGIDPLAWHVGDHDAPPGFATLTVATAGEAARQPLSITRMDVEVRIEGRLARTRLTQVFQNPQVRAVEGTYELTLPPGAAVTRLAMDVDGVMTEGELVERERARAVYEGIAAARKDPALMEWHGLERFRTRVWPIPAQGTKTLVVEYEQLLPVGADGARYRLGLPRVLDTTGAALGAFTFSLVYEGPHTLVPVGAAYPIVWDRAERDAQQATLSLPAFVPQGDLELALRPDGDGPAVELHTATRAFAAAERSPERFFAADVRVAADAERVALPQRVVFVVDTSASLRGAGLDAARAIVREAAARLGAERVVVVHGSIAPQRCTGALEACLDALVAAGATDLGALVAAGLDAAAAGTGDAALVLLSDGRATLGELELEALAALWGAAQRPGLRAHALALGAGPDESPLRTLAGHTGGHHLRVPLAAPASEVAAVLEALLQVPAVTGLEAVVVEGEVDGLHVAAPAVAAGERVLVLGRVASERAVVELRGTLGGAPLVARLVIEEPDPERESHDPLLSRFWARAELVALEAGGARDEAVALSQTYGVLSRYTSLLVLESERMYAEAGIERRQEAEHQAAIARGERPEDAVGAAAYDADWHGLGAEQTSPDSDGDAVFDAVDQCPLEPETWNGFMDEDGCPDHGMIRLEDTSIRIIEYVHFEAGKTQIDAQGLRLLEEVAYVLRDWPTIGLVAIDGHTDDREVRAAKRVALATRRAEAVRDALVELGVEPERLVVRAFGEERPIDTHATAEGRARNRRVEFQLLEMDHERPTHLARMAELTAMTTRTPAQDAELLGLLVAHGGPGESAALHDALTAAASTAEARVAIYASRAACTRFLDACLAAALAAPQAVADDTSTALHLAALPGEDAAEQLEALSGLRAPGAAAAREILSAAFVQAPQLAPRLLERWHSRFDASERFAILDGLGLSQRPEVAALLVDTALELPDPDAAAQLARAAELAAVHGLGERLAPRLATLCESTATLPELDLCLGWLAAGQLGAGHDGLAERLHVRALEAALALRAQDVAAPALIERHTQALDALGRGDEAVLVLTELVEFAPRDATAHLRLADALGRMDPVDPARTGASCTALAAVLGPEATLPQGVCAR